eukprot:scpid98058/ scgid4682/ 
MQALHLNQVVTCRDCEVTLVQFSHGHCHQEGVHGQDATQNLPEICLHGLTYPEALMNLHLLHGRGCNYLWMWMRLHPNPPQLSLAPLALLIQYQRTHCLMNNYLNSICWLEVVISPILHQILPCKISRHKDQVRLSCKA